MRNFKLTKLGEKRFKGRAMGLYSKDFEYDIRPTPGDWGYFSTSKGNYIGFVNPLTDESRAQAWIIQSVDMGLSAREYVEKCLDEAFSFRKRIQFLDEGARLFYGSVEGLPGLVIDAFKNAIIVQIETAGVDQFRDLIKEFIESRYEQTVYFWDKKVRQKENIPIYSPTLELEELHIEDSGFSFSISANTAQKSGYYYDHRKNRQSFERLINAVDIPKEKGLDLFSYLGTWGFHQIRAGVNKVDFVDQANLEEVYKNNLSLNDYKDNGEFIKNSVFDFLKQAISQNQKYSVISCDPPAFAKSKDKKIEAIRGYKKLHGQVFDVAAQGSLVAFASCTQYVNLEEFETTIIDSAQQKKRRVKLLDCGLQAWDHPLPRLKSSSNYIKYLAYLVD